MGIALLCLVLIGFSVDSVQHYQAEKITKNKTATQVEHSEKNQQDQNQVTAETTETLQSMVITKSK